MNRSSGENMRLNKYLKNHHGRCENTSEIDKKQAKADSAQCHQFVAKVLVEDRHVMRNLSSVERLSSHVGHLHRVAVVDFHTRQSP